MLSKVTGLQSGSHSAAVEPTLVHYGACAQQGGQVGEDSSLGHKDPRRQCYLQKKSRQQRGSPPNSYNNNSQQPPTATQFTSCLPRAPFHIILGNCGPEKTSTLSRSQSWTRGSVLSPKPQAFQLHTTEDSAHVKWASGYPFKPSLNH